MGIMYDVMQGIFVSVIEGAFGLAKDTLAARKVANMDPEQLTAWRAGECAKIREEAVKWASHADDKKLAKQGMTRDHLIRTYEVMRRDELGQKRRVNLLEGMDIRGLDLRKLRRLTQKQIDEAFGDACTQLPNHLKPPDSWGSRM